MALPKIKHPTFSLELISSGKTVRYRPFTVKEEKILLVAQLSNDHKQVNDAIKQVITNCVTDLNFDVDSLATFDVEYFFINLRSKSVNNIVDIYLKDLEDEKQYNFKVNLDEIKIIKNPNHSKKIHLHDELGVVMKYPNYTIGAGMFSKEDGVDDITALLEMIAKCIDTIYDGEKIYVAGEDFDTDEAITFVNDLPIEAVDKFKDFFDTLPEIEYVINYTNSLGNERSYKLSGINDFFT
jgi:hypothetical protein